MPSDEMALENALHSEWCENPACGRPFMTRGGDIYCPQCRLVQARRCAVEREESIRQRLTDKGVLRPSGAEE